MDTRSKYQANMSPRVRWPHISCHDTVNRSWHPYRGYIKKKPNLLNRLGLVCGGETGIRTLGGIAATIDFESIPFGHSGISPWGESFTQAGPRMQ